MGKLHDGTCETPFLATKSAAMPLHFIVGSIGGIGKARATVSVYGLHLGARFDSAGVIFGPFSMGKLHDGTCQTGTFFPGWGTLHCELDTLCDSPNKTKNS